MNDIESVETDAQRDTRLRQARTRRALLHAPEVVKVMCDLVFPTDGRTERGEDVPAARIPMRGHALDDVNELYGALVEGVGEFAEALGDDAQDAGRFARWQTRNVEGHVVASVYGLPDRFTPGIAETLTRNLCVWLLGRVERIEAVPGGVEFFDDVTSMVWRFRYGYRMTLPGLREVSARPCPRCDSPVSVEWFGEPIAQPERRGEFLPIRLSTVRDRRDPKSTAGRLVLDLHEGVTVTCTKCVWSLQRAPLTELVDWAVKGGRRPDGSVKRALLLTIPQAAEAWDVTERTIRNWINSGDVTLLPGKRVHESELRMAYTKRAESKRAREWRAAHDPEDTPPIPVI